MRVLGIDQAMDNKCGFAVVDDQGVVYTYMETYKGIKHGCTRQRCYRFGAVLQTIYNTYKPDAVVTEMVRAFHQGQVNKHTISALSQLQGVINVVIPQPVPVYIVNTGSWQAQMLAPKRTGIDVKTLSAMYVQDKYGLDVPHHVSDAINMALYLQLMENQLRRHVLELVS